MRSAFCLTVFMVMQLTTPYPSCRTTTQMLALSGNNGSTVELDLCFQYQGMWVDPQENLKLAPAAVAELFRQLHEQRDAPRQPLVAQTHCPRCAGSLTQGFDVVPSGRYITYRCIHRKPRCSSPRPRQRRPGWAVQIWSSCPA